MERVDVAVVGGGPAGATAARRLAAAGLEVRLLEKRQLPRYKTCGGGLVGRAVDWLEVDIEPVVESHCHRAEMRFVDEGLGFEVADHDPRDETARPVVTMTMRADLDRLLVAAAQAAGAELDAPRAVLGLERHPDHVRLDTDSGPLAARFVVAADGAAGKLARWAGWRRDPPRAAGIESEIAVPAATRERYAGRALFDFGFVPDGYAWVFPKRHHLSVGCLSTRAGARHLRPRLDGYLERLGIEVRAREDHGFVIPLAPRAPDLARGRVLLTGDAAGLADPISCEGISFAALSGRLAAEAIVTGGGEPAAAARIYQRGLRREILSELAAARPLARLLYHHPETSRRILRRAGAPLCRAMVEVLSGRATYRGLARAPRNWAALGRRLVLGGREPGPGSPGHPVEHPVDDHTGGRDVEPDR